MKNSVASKCKAVAVLLGIIGFVVSFALAYQISSLYEKVPFIKLRKEPNWGVVILVLLIGLLISFIIALLIYAVGEIIEQLNITADRNARIISILEENQITESIKTEEAERLHKTNKDDWYCANCERWNKVYFGTCRCGKTKGLQ